MLALDKYISEFNLPDPPGFRDKCSRFYELLSAANAMTNLTRIESEEGFAVKHVADSLYIVKFFPFIVQTELELADVGCGAGFPSAVLAMAFPQLRITAIDSVGKKTAFLENAANELELNNLQVIHAHTSELARRPEYRGRYGIVTARAVGTAAKLYELARKLARGECRYIFYKTPSRAAEELSELAASAPQIIWRKTPDFTLPGTAGERCFIYSE